MQKVAEFKQDIIRHSIGKWGDLCRGHHIKSLGQVYIFLWMSCDVVGCHRMFLGQGIWLSCCVQKAGNGCQRIFKGDFNGCPMTSYGQGMSQSTFKGL